MTSKTIKGHNNLNLGSYGQLFVLVCSTVSKNNMSAYKIGCDLIHKKEDMNQCK